MQVPETNDASTTIRVSLRDMLINLMTSPIALDPNLASEFVQRLLIAHGWCIREATLRMAMEQLAKPDAALPATYLEFLHSIAMAERKETAQQVRDITEPINTAMGIKPKSRLN